MSPIRTRSVVSSRWVSKTRRRLDILVANAGRGAGTDKATVAESDPGVWRDLLHVNLLGAYHCAREAIPYLLEGGSSERPS